jgi:PAS domain S-box-containing protein
MTDPHAATSAFRTPDQTLQAWINQRVFDTSLDLILVVDPKGNFIRVSPSSAAILGYQPEEMVGHSAVEFIYPEDLDSTRNEMRLARRGRVMRNFECRYIHKNGRVVTLAWTGQWSESDRQHFFIGRDMTERMRLEGQLRQAQKMEAIGQLTGGIAHDFNNILTVIIGMVELLAPAIDADPRLAPIVKAIDDAAERGAELTRRMLAFARKQPLQPRPLDLNEVITRIAEMLQRTLGEDVTVRTVLADDLWRAVADPFLLEDAILNLAVNARDAMPKGGHLVIETDNAELDENFAAENLDVSAGEYVSLLVSDTGTGMKPEVIERAFEPFFTTKDVGRGTGLGLSMVYGFVKQIGGHVRIHSEVGRGTTVKIYLRRAADTASQPTEASASSAESLPIGRETILIVEDNAAVRAASVSILESLGYGVLQAADGWDAHHILESPAKIDLLFTDLVMPNGIGGEDLARIARKLRPGLKLLYTTGYSAQLVRARSDKDVPVLSKPYRRHKLAAMVRAVLEDRPAKLR